MSAIQERVNPRAYSRLLAKVRPAVIKTEEENERMLAVVEQLMAKGENLKPEEGELLELLGQLIADFEEAYYQPAEAALHEVLRELMSARDLEQKDLYDLFGSKGRTSEAVSGKRSISKSQAKALAEFFHVPAGLFI
jgi:HTH-type transcriptional regulator / antitoxin HigA